MKKYAIGLTVAAVFSLVGCSTSLVTRNQSIAVPTSQILEQGMSQATVERNIPVLLIRDAGFMGSFVDATVVVDGIKLVTLKPEQRFEFFLSAGSHVFAVFPAGGSIREPAAENDIEIKSSGNNNFRLRMVYGDGPRIERSSQIAK